MAVTQTTAFKWERESSFFTPTTIVDSSRSKLNWFCHAIGNTADRYLSLGSEKVEWHSKIVRVMKDGEETAVSVLERKDIPGCLDCLMWKIITIVSYILIIPVLLTLPVKVLYRTLSVNSTLGNLTPIQTDHPWNLDWKGDFEFVRENIDKDLGNWFISQFSQNRATVFETFRDLRHFLEPMEGEAAEIDKAVWETNERTNKSRNESRFVSLDRARRTSMEDHLFHEFTERTNLVGPMLRGFTLPAEGHLRFQVERLLYSAWHEAVRRNGDLPCWPAPGDPMSRDSLTILHRVLNNWKVDIALRRQELGNENYKNLYHQCLQNGKDNPDHIDILRKKAGIDDPRPIINKPIAIELKPLDISSELAQETYGLKHVKE